MNNRKSFSFSSEAFEAITHRHQKEGQPEGQRACNRARPLRVPGKKIAMEQEQ